MHRLETVLGLQPRDGVQGLCPFLVKIALRLVTVLAFPASPLFTSPLLTPYGVFTQEMDYLPSWNIKDTTRTPHCLLDPGILQTSVFLWGPLTPHLIFSILLGPGSAIPQAFSSVTDRRSPLHPWALATVHLLQDTQWLSVVHPDIQMEVGFPGRKAGPQNYTEF